jgi:hypothetical protein
VIVYNLHCPSGHEFEGWFKDMAAYDQQSGSGALSCPMCGGTKIEKSIMAPAVKGSATKAKGKAEPTPEQRAEMRRFMSGYRKFVEANSEYVGKEFAGEARKIHHGEAEERPIYGESTLAEAKELVEEGIKIAPVPLDPDELN